MSSEWGEKLWVAEDLIDKAEQATDVSSAYADLTAAFSLFLAISDSGDPIQQTAEFAELQIRHLRALRRCDPALPDDHAVMCRRMALTSGLNAVVGYQQLGNHEALTHAYMDVGTLFLDRMNDGDREDQDATLLNAAEAFEMATSLISKDTAPDLWAEAQRGLGFALMFRYTSPGAAERSEKLLLAASCFEGAMSVWPVGRDPQVWLDLADRVLSCLAVVATLDGTSEALASINERRLCLSKSALDMFANDPDPVRLAVRKVQHADILNRLSDDDVSVTGDEALALLREARAVFEAAGESSQAGMAHFRIGSLLFQRSQERTLPQEQALLILEDAIASLRIAATTLSPAEEPPSWAFAYYFLGLALTMKATLSPDDAALDVVKDAETAFQHAKQSLDPATSSQILGQVKESEQELAKLRRTLAPSGIQKLFGGLFNR